MGATVMTTISVDEELDALEKKDIEIQSTLMLISNKLSMTNIGILHRDLSRTCDLSRILAVSKSLH